MQTDELLVTGWNHGGLIVLTKINDRGTKPARLCLIEKG
jgi:hypothetical protein